MPDTDLPSTAPAVSVSGGQWMCVEQMVKLNNPVSSANGEHAIWLNGTNALTAVRFVYKTMGSYSFDMWSRAAREIGDAYWREETPLNALLRLDLPPPVLHLYGEPVDPSYLVAQQAFAFEHPWFEVMKLDAHSHFSLLEIPGEVARVIETFLRS